MQEHGDHEVGVVDETYGQPGQAYMTLAPRKMRLGDYIRRVTSGQRQELRMFLFNVRMHLPELLDDVRPPEIARRVNQSVVFMFFGCMGSVTPVHFDIDMADLFHTSFWGEKRVTLFAPSESKKLYRHPCTVRSCIDVDNPDYEKYPRFEDARGMCTTLTRGETLYIPSGYWHHMVYDQGGYALTHRCSPRSRAVLVRGLFNFVVLRVIDGWMNKLLDARWFRFKEWVAARRAA